MRRHHCYDDAAGVDNIIFTMQLWLSMEPREKDGINTPPHSEACFELGLK